MFLAAGALTITGAVSCARLCLLPLRCCLNLQYYHARLSEHTALLVVMITQHEAAFHIKACGCAFCLCASSRLAFLAYTAFGACRIAR